MRLVPALTLLLLIGPILAGLVGTILPAFGYLPALASRAAAEVWLDLATRPGLASAVWLSFSSGLAATLLSFLIVVFFCAGWHGTALFQRLNRLLSPLLSVPHVTMAFALAFLLAPSGWLLRLLSPWASGLQRPPDWLIIQDPHGLSLTLCLIVKEVPFLFLMMLAALGQNDAAGARPLARTLGYGASMAWLIAVLPRVYRQLRLPLFAVLAFSLSVVDVSLVLAPNTPPPLPVLLLRWFNDPDFNLRFVASAGALLLCALVAAAAAVWVLLEYLARRFGLALLRRGLRLRSDAALRYSAAAAVIGCFLLALLGIVALALWSVTTQWRFPQALPSGVSLANWSQALSNLAEPLWTTLWLGAGSAGSALLLTLGCLENEARGRRASNRSLWLLYLPLLIPQIAFLFGLQVMLSAARLDGSAPALLWAHLVFVLPYVFLSLAEPYRRWDERYARTALCLGASQNRVWLQVKLPMLLRPILTALAVGFAVSVAQYLPTLFAGAGRQTTLTTEAVNLSAGGDRRAIGVYAMLQLALPLAGFLLAQLLPAWRYRNRRGLQTTPARHS